MLSTLQRKLLLIPHKSYTHIGSRNRSGQSASKLARADSLATARSLGAAALLHRRKRGKDDVLFRTSERPLTDWWTPDILILIRLRPIVVLGPLWPVLLAYLFCAPPTRAHELSVVKDHPGMATGHAIFLHVMA